MGKKLAILGKYLPTAPCGISRALSSLYSAYFLGNQEAERLALLGGPSKAQRHADAHEALAYFQGHSAGGLEDFQRLERIVRAARFDIDQLHDLRTQLPIGIGGTTGQRVSRIDRLLKRLEKEAGQ